jgi:hypothetical protein
MRLAALALGLLLSLSQASAPQADPAAFTGTWTAVSDAPAGIRAAPSPVFGPTFGLRVNATHGVVQRAMRGETAELSLPLDGTPATFRFSARPCEGDQQYIETLSWENGGLALKRTGVVAAGGGPVRPVTAGLTFRPGPDETLVVEGRMAQRGGEPIPVATVYRRSPTPMPDPPARPTIKMAEATIAALAWLPGTWSGLNGQVTVEERWTPVASGSMQGMGRTLRGEAQVAFEFFCVAERDGSLVYTAWPNARTTPTSFYLTSATADVATFENPEHNFPQVVKYTRLPDGSLQTTIRATDGSRATSFTMTKQP